MFEIGSYYPHPDHVKRLKRYRENKKLFLGEQFEVLEKHFGTLSQAQQRAIYVTANLAGIICKKNADFLFGENAVYSAGKEDNSPEQKAIERLVDENELNITNYESALSNSYRGDSFYKIRYGQEQGGLLPPSIDPFKVIIEAQNAEFVFPETYPNDNTKIMGFHIAIPQEVKRTHSEEWVLNVESHFPNKLIKRKFRMNPTVTNVTGYPTEWRIYAEIGEPEVKETGVPFPLVVHIPNYTTDDTWEGIDDISEHRGIFAEINNRLSQIAEILDKHADPALIVPQGTLVEGEDGSPQFRVGVDKVFEVMDNKEVKPEYVTWNGQLEYAFRELEKLLDLLLMSAEIPMVALGAGDSGTSGSSGLAIKWRMNSLLAKINRKRQYYDKGLKRVLLIAQLLEHDRKSKVDYEITKPLIKFKDGLPEDDTEKANVMSVRTGGKATISQVRAIMELENCTEEQARLILKQIEEEERVEELDAFQTPALFDENEGEEE